MQSLNQISKILKELSKEELFDIASSKFDEVYSFISQNNNLEKPLELLIDIIYMAVGTDGILSSGEYNFITSFIGEENVDIIVNRASKNDISNKLDDFKEFVNNLTPEIKEALTYLILCVYISDNQLASNENIFLNYIY